MRREKISKIVVINGPETTAGSSLSLLQIRGRSEPNEVAATTVINILKATQTPKRELFWSRKALRRASPPKGIPKSVPMKISFFATIHTSFNLTSPIASPRTTAMAA